MRKKSFYARIWSKLKRFAQKEALAAPGDRILIAVSGGPDSVCLADFLSRIKKEYGLKLKIVHVHHGLRGRAADLDALFVQKLGAKLGLDCAVKNADVPAYLAGHRATVEEAGRRLRYQILERIAKKEGFNKIAVGHQLDDQAETALLNLIRGGTLKKIPVKRPLKAAKKGRASAGNPIWVIRPLMALTRKEVLQYLKVLGLSFRTDESNLSLKFTRNWVRRKLIPLLETKNPRIKEGLAKASWESRYPGP